MMIILRLHLLDHLAESLSEFFDELPLEGLDGFECTGQSVLDKALMHKVGLFHDLRAKFGVGLKSFKAVMVVRGVPDPFPLASGELSLVRAVCFDAKIEIVSVLLNHFKKIEF
jgi:hypothetical protein